MTEPQRSWQEAYRAQMSPEEHASMTRTKRWLWGSLIMLIAWIVVVLLAFTVFGTKS